MIWTYKKDCIGQKQIRLHWINKKDYNGWIEEITLNKNII